MRVSLGLFLAMLNLTAFGPSLCLSQNTSTEITCEDDPEFKFTVNGKRLACHEIRFVLGRFGLRNCEGISEEAIYFGKGGQFTPVVEDTLIIHCPVSCNDCHLLNTTSKSSSGLPPALRLGSLISVVVCVHVLRLLP
ncbi:hypothetical protein CYMTET_52992 [Cymbomonas tetramitiformis]|uniref:Uncharacterized protein n=1 Tax=Cymbomonas tetramitiformis TaxID=36881 RepID=A0AAE0BI54_9CHLO|nr:hypothetical protein CYMTET_52992 [Cymbomonas tetramitiformis]